MDDDMKAQIEPAKDALRKKVPRVETGKLSGCTSYVQRTLQCGYNRAASIMDFLVEQHFITEPDHRGERSLVSSLPKTPHKEDA